MNTAPPLRIVDSDDNVDPGQLLANPLNWRIHSHLQESAVEGAIDEIGFVRRVLVNRTTGHVVDGHLRVAIAIKRGYTVPVDYVQLSEDEEHRALALLDSTAALAGTDDDQVKALIAAQSVPTNQAIAAMFDRRLDADAIIAAAQKSEPAVENPPAPGAALIVECSDADDRQQLMDRLRGDGYSCRPLRRLR